MVQTQAEMNEIFLDVPEAVINNLILLIKLRRMNSQESIILIFLY